MMMLKDASDDRDALHFQDPPFLLSSYRYRLKMLSYFHLFSHCQTSRVLVEAVWALEEDSKRLSDIDSSLQ